MWEWLKDAGKGVADWVAKPDNLKTVAIVGSGIADYKSAKKEASLANELLNIQKQQYERAVGKENKAQSNIDSAFSSAFSEKKEDEPQMNLGV